ncbi:hypothetical protein P775_17320 [Puniceibacterium antarcticum]|uniref:Glycosyltransferase 2-like domain-containing protein n=1 Tax=Puniceibacterium antarcticum TaxID=1206336 RepID=A0A2G8RCV0_9RHOB|nr:glycosyltransferase family 2 protein [Puniceibacterium antarcticum]PIL18928.1 hypothetical protein P775_17320 [Puniceibacterium antarcticum]
MAQAAIIIPHFNDIARLLRCLAALMPQVTAEVEVVVADNSSTQPLDPVRAAFPDLRIVTEPRPGAAMARNCGVAHTTAPQLFFLDCDCVPAPDWLAVALAIADRSDVIGGTITVFDETPPPRSGAEAFETVFAFDNRGYIENKGFSVTANLLTRRDVFAAVGPFSSGLSEDLDWCHRATAQGFALIHEDALRVAHPTRSDWTALVRKWRRLTIESWGLQGSGPGARLRWGLRALALPLSVLAHMPKVLASDRLSGAERRSALATLARLRLRRCGWMLWQVLGRQI